MTPNSLDRLLRQRNVLMLQGPMGPFFCRLARLLRTRGQQVTKVNFNGGDEWFFKGPDAIAYDGTAEVWPEWLGALLTQRRIDAIVLFGQSRAMHEAAMKVAHDQRITVYVFEEGYVRPDYVTLEVGGVNAASSVPREAAFYTRVDPDGIPLPQPTHQNFKRMAAYAMTYALARELSRRRFPHYKHHRSLHPVRIGLKWVRGAWRKNWYEWRERDLLPYLSSPENHKQWFFVPLQVYNDSQIRRFSPYEDVSQFIEEVLRSFAEHAPPETRLVFKHHPMDRPYRDYSELIGNLCGLLDIADRVHYLHDQHLPTLLKHARGVITVNSTTGMQAMYHGTPVIALGECMYNIDGLCHRGPLDDFWGAPGKVDMDLYRRFRAHLLRETQLNASFYADAPGLSSITEASLPRAIAASRPARSAQSAS